MNRKRVRLILRYFTNPNILTVGRVAGDGVVKIYSSTVYKNNVRRSEWLDMKLKELQENGYSGEFAHGYQQYLEDGWEADW